MSRSPRDAFLAAQAAMLARHDVRAESRFVPAASVDGRAHVLCGGHGPPVLLLNGLGTPAAMWAPLLSGLGAFRWHAVDGPAFGLTDSLDTPPRELRPYAVRFLEDVLDGLGLRTAVLVGNSLGSLWTNWFALDRPGRVAALVHLGCPAAVLETSAPLPMRLMSIPVLGRLLTTIRPPSEAQVEELARMVGEHPLSPELAGLLLATERLPRFRQTFLATLSAVIRPGGSRAEARLTAEQLGETSQPTLVVWGEHDPFGSVATGERMVAALPRGEFVTVPAGHAPWLKNGETIAERIEEFLGRVLAP